jgi:hypothetical protein
LILQPCVAVFFAFRAGMRDYRGGRNAYLRAIADRKGERSTILRDGWKDVKQLFVVALAMDMIYQLIVFEWFYLGQAMLVAAALAILPYILIRGPTTRIAKRLGAKHRTRPAPPLEGEPPRSFSA